MAKAKITKKQTETPAAEPKAEQKKPASPNAGINRGRTTGMRVMQFQDKLLADNAKTHLSDEQLLKALRDEFPNAKGKIFTAPTETRLAILRSVRRLYNAGKHGAQTAKPTVTVPEYDAHGKPVAETKAPRGAAKTAA